MADRRRALIVGGLAGVAMLVVLGARLVGRDDPPVACGPPKPAPAAETALMPAGLSFRGIGTVTRVRREKRHTMVQAVTTKPLDEATVLIQDAVVAAGYRPAGMDNEGFEAEVFFTTGPYAAGMATLRRCRARWDVNLFLLDRKAGRAADG